MPAIVLTIIQGIMAAVQAAPQIASVISNAKGFITSLVEAKLIDVNLQNTLHGWVDGQAKLAALGVVSPAWTVEPDPTATTATAATTSK